jgi:hypothetical protein
MFLSAVNGRYWVELVDPVTADWESLRMNHGIAKEFREAMRTRTVLPPVALALLRHTLERMQENQHPRLHREFTPTKRKILISLDSLYRMTE